MEFKHLANNVRKSRYFLLTVLSLTVLVLFLSFHYYNRVGAFGCFDDCTVFAAGHFLLLGRQMYSEIFFNHQMLMPYISAAIIAVTNPETMYQLVLYHRLFIIAFSWISMIFLVWRFRWAGILSILIYEPLKFYFFGDRFLPESMIAYTGAYLIGVVWTRLSKSKIYNYDYYVSAILASLVVLIREPYVPAVLLLFGLISLSYPLVKSHIKSILMFVVLTGVVYVFHPLHDYIDTVILVNAQGVAAQEIASNNIVGTGLIQVMLYPFYILFSGENTFLRLFLVIYSLIFIALSAVIGFKFKKLKLVLVVWIILGTIGIRTVSPGYQYYEAFHLVPWMAMFAMLIGLFIVNVAQQIKFKKAMILLSVAITIVALTAVFHPRSFIYTQINAQDEFEIGYSYYQQYANYILVLKEDDHTLFVDEWDDIMYWATGMDSAYQYGLYTPWNQAIPRYEEAKVQMMSDNPPDIYYCSEGFKYGDKEILASVDGAPYSQVLKDGKELCLYVHNDVIDSYSKEKKEAIMQAGLIFQD